MVYISGATFAQALTVCMTLAVSSETGEASTLRGATPSDMNCPSILDFRCAELTKSQRQVCPSGTKSFCEAHHAKGWLLQAPSEVEMDPLTAENSVLGCSTLDPYDHQYHMTGIANDGPIVSIVYDTTASTHQALCIYAGHVQNAEGQKLVNIYQAALQDRSNSWVPAFPKESETGWQWEVSQNQTYTSGVCNNDEGSVECSFTYKP